MEPLGCVMICSLHEERLVQWLFSDILLMMTLIKYTLEVAQEPT